MEDSLENTAQETIHDLNIRLRRIEFLLLGNDPDPSTTLEDLALSSSPLTRENTIMARLQALDKALGGLYSRSPTVRGLLDIYVQHPDLFHPPPTSTPNPQHLLPPNPSLSSHHQGDSLTDFPTASTLTQAEKLSTILASASSFQAFSSQLNSIMDSPIPNPASSAEIVSLLPRIHKLELLQEAQMREIQKLRRRTVEVLERWYLIGVEGVNECFAEWDERTLEVEKRLARKVKALEEA